MIIKLSRRITRAILVAILICFVSVYVFLRIYGKGLLTKRLSSALDRRVEIGSFAFAFPFGFSIRNLKITNMLESKKVFLQINALSLLTHNLHFYSLRFIEPVLYMQRTKDSKIILGKDDPAEREENKDIEPKAPDNGKDIQESNQVILAEELYSVSISRLKIQNGKLEFFDRSAMRGGFGFGVDDINLTADGVTFPAQPRRMKFKFIGSFGGYKALSKGGQVRGQGWADFVNKDMEATLKVIDDNGNVGLFADLYSRKNDMKVTGKLQLQDFLFKKGSLDDSESLDLKDVVFGALQSTGAIGTGLMLDFNFKTKMDDFSIAQISFSGSVRE